ncbi:FAD-linked sulfhydryl oxidase ERV2, partial [Lachnellula suecica]
MPRRQNITVLIILAISAFLAFTFVLSFKNREDDGLRPADILSYKQDANVEEGLLKGAATAHKLENATLKAELGNASWKLLHTMMAKFPDTPTPDDSAALKSYIHLFARLYPCGDCARHFQKVLEKYPPQVASRSTAAAWACHVHNVVNKRLKKKEFDCS